MDSLDAVVCRFGFIIKFLPNLSFLPLNWIGGSRSKDDVDDDDDNKFALRWMRAYFSLSLCVSGLKKIKFCFRFPFPLIRIWGFIYTQTHIGKKEQNEK